MVSSWSVIIYLTDSSKLVLPKPTYLFIPVYILLSMPLVDEMVWVVGGKNNGSLNDDCDDDPMMEENNKWI